MARIQTHPIMNQLRVARSCAEQITALRALKNEIVGHAQKKERWVELGVLELVVKVLGGRRSSPKLSGRDARSHGSLSRQLSEEEKVRLQALQVLASFATGELLVFIAATGQIRFVFGLN
jgi:armadillo repeat-containing protein 8